MAACPIKSVSLETAQAAFISFLRYERRYALHSVSAYQQDLDAFIAYVQAERCDAFALISAPIIRAWLTDLRQKGFSFRSIARKCSAIRCFFRFCLKENYIVQNPTTLLNTPKIPRTLSGFLSKEQTHTLLCHITYPDNWKGYRDKLILTTFYATGMRVSELNQLTDNAIDPHKKEIKIQGKGNKQRIIPLADTLLDALKRYVEKRATLQPAHPYLWINERGKQLSNRAIYQIVHHYLGQISSLKKRSPHVLRHTFATHLLNEGASIVAIKALLGHSSLAATQIYTHNQIEQLKAVYQKAHPKAQTSS